MTLEVNLTHVRDFFWSRRPSRRDSFDFGVLANFVPDGDAYSGVCRAGAMTHDDQIQIIHFDSNLNLVETKPATKGEDPRSFTYKGNPYALTWDPHSHHGVGVFAYKIINLKNGEVTRLNIENFPTTPVSTLGKNWIPVERDGVLYFVVTLEPELNILRCELSTGNCVWETPYERIKESLDITISRGGTSLIFQEEYGCFVGIGHRTYNCHHHAAYLYTLSKDFNNVYIGPDIETGREGVNDPVSIYEERNKLFCCIGHFPIQLGDTTEALSALYEVKIT